MVRATSAFGGGNMGVFEGQAFMVAPTQGQLAATPMAATAFKMHRRRHKKHKKQRYYPGYGMFGFGQGAVDPITAANLPLTQLAKDLLAQYRAMLAVIPQLQGSYRSDAEASLRRNWYSGNIVQSILGIGRYTLAELDKMITPWVNEGVFVTIDPNFDVNYRRRDILYGLRDGVNDLKKHMPIMSLPTLSQTAESLLAQTQVLADMARKSGRVEDAIAAREVASVASAAGAGENKPSITAEADKIHGEMDAMAQRGGAPGRSVQQAAPAGAFPMTPVLIGVGAAVAIGLVVYLVKKS